MKINEMIDHTILKADASRVQIIEYCKDAIEYEFASVCVNSTHVKLVSDELKDTSVKVCSVVGFPLGSMSMLAKGFEAKQAVSDGADEIDMVINIGALKDGDYDFVKKDIKNVIEESRPAIVKVIIETCLLSKEEKIKACQLAIDAGADFVKTSTGFSTAGAKIEDIRFIRNIIKNKAQIKASGGIRTPEDAKNMIEAGADRIGTSDGVALL